MPFILCGFGTAANVCRRVICSYRIYCFCARTSLLHSAARFRLHLRRRNLRTLALRARVRSPDGVPRSSGRANPSSFFGGFGTAANVCYRAINSYRIYCFLHATFSFVRCRQVSPYSIRRNLRTPALRARVRSPDGVPKQKDCISQSFCFGTPSGTRTLDTLIKSQVLYQLS